MKTQIKGKKNKTAEILISVQSTAVGTPGDAKPRPNPNRIGLADVAAEDAQTLLCPQNAEEGARESTDLVLKSKMDSNELAGGFEKSEQLKILYLAQWYNLEKQLRLKLNAFGNNQISR